MKMALVAALALLLAGCTGQEPEVPRTLVGPFANLELEALSTNTYNPVGMIRAFEHFFVDDECRDFVPTGWNTWNSPLLEQAMTAADGDPETAAILDSLFYGASEYGFNVMRMFGFGVQNKTVLQTAPGEYDEAVFRGFDYLLNLARRYSVKIIWAFTTHWQSSDAPESYLSWCGKCTGPDGRCTTPDLDQFWTDECTIGLFKNHINATVHRVNSINGLQYKDDDTFFSWNLYNEPRCPANQTQEYTDFCEPALLEWTENLGEFVKSVDPNHMLTWGHEGFFANHSRYAGANPYGTPSNVNSGWSAFVGQDFEAQQGVQWIDFMQMHMWPDNWNSALAGGDLNVTLNWVSDWISAHLEVAREQRKPLIMQEFGKRSLSEDTGDIRDPIFAEVYGHVAESLQAEDALRGDLFWNWDPFNYQTVNLPLEEPGLLPPAANAVKNDQTTFGLVTEHAQMSAKYGGADRTAQGCVPRSSSSIEPVAVSISG